MRAFGASGVRLGTLSGGPPFCSAAATRLATAAARVERSKSRPLFKASCSQTARTEPSAAFNAVWRRWVT